jgi:hypothetical protein
MIEALAVIRSNPSFNARFGRGPGQSLLGQPNYRLSAVVSEGEHEGVAFNLTTEVGFEIGQEVRVRFSPDDQFAQPVE